MTTQTVNMLAGSDAAAAVAGGAGSAAGAAAAANGAQVNAAQVNGAQGNGALARDGGWLAPGPNSKWRLSFGGVLRGEIRKMFSLRSTIWCTVLVFSMVIGGTVSWTLLVLSESSLRMSSMLHNLHQTVQLPQSLVALVVAVLGVLIATSEYSSKMIISTLTVAPRRGMLFTAKAVTAALYGFVLGVIINVVPAVVCAVMYGSEGIAVLGEWRLWFAMFLSSVYYMIVSLVSYGIGMIVRSTAGAVSITMLLLFVVVIVLSMMSIMHKEWINFLNDYCLPVLGQRVTSYGIDPNLIAGVTGWQLAAGLGFWCLVSLVPGFILFKKRDVI